MLPLKWDNDTCKIINRPLATPPVEMPDVDTVTTEIVYVERPSFHYIDTADLRRKLYETDSVVKISDSLYVFFKCPDYLFVNSYNADNHSTKKILSSADMYRTIIRNYQKPDRASLLKRMEALKIKYAASRRYSYSDYDVTYNENDSYEVKIKKKNRYGNF